MAQRVPRPHTGIQLLYLQRWEEVLPLAHEAPEDGLPVLAEQASVTELAAPVQATPRAVRSFWGARANASAADDTYLMEKDSEPPTHRLRHQHPHASRPRHQPDGAILGPFFVRA